MAFLDVNSQPAPVLKYRMHHRLTLRRRLCEPNKQSFKTMEGNVMTKTVWTTAMALVFCVCVGYVEAQTIRGHVVDASGKAMEGVMVSAFDKERQQSISVFSQADGSFAIDGLLDVTSSDQK